MLPETKREEKKKETATRRRRRQNRDFGEAFGNLLMGRGRSPPLVASMEGLPTPAVSPSITWIPLSSDSRRQGCRKQLSWAGPVKADTGSRQSSSLAQTRGFHLAGQLYWSSLQMQTPRWESKNRCQESRYRVGFCKSAKSGQSDGSRLNGATNLSAYMRGLAGLRPYMLTGICAWARAHTHTQGYIKVPKI